MHRMEDSWHTIPAALSIVWFPLRYCHGPLSPLVGLMCAIVVHRRRSICHWRAMLLDTLVMVQPIYHSSRVTTMIVEMIHLLPLIVRLHRLMKKAQHDGQPTMYLEWSSLQCNWASIWMHCPWYSAIIMISIHPWKAQALILHLHLVAIPFSGYVIGGGGVCMDDRLINCGLHNDRLSHYCLLASISSYRVQANALLHQRFASSSISSTRLISLSIVST